MNKNEKYLLTMVFGQVKTGKSSLGNFIAGKKFYNAKFDNEYKNYAHPVFCNEKAGREGNITVDDSGRPQTLIIPDYSLKMSFTNYK